MKVVALIPSYQPDGRLVELMAALRARGLEGVVVDDGSGPQYSDTFRQVAESATVIGYETNQGKGHALKCGLRHILACYEGDDVVVTVDADGQHDIDDVVRCAGAAKGAGHAMVLGSRSFEGLDVPLRSRVGNRLTSSVYHLASGLTVSDTQTGLRAFPVEMAEFLLEVGGERYEYEMNVLLACPAHHVEIRTVPIRTIYEGGNAGSHFRALRDSARIYAGIFAFMASSFASFLVDYALFGLLSALLAGYGGLGLVAANVAARLVSATTNFFVNRNLVFRSEGSLYVAAVRYALLAMGILVINTLSVLVLVDVLGVSALVAKLAVEVTLFVLSWLLQSRVIFGGELGGKECACA